MQAGHARFVPGTQFQRVDRPITKGEGDRFGLVPPPVICQIPGICVRASVIVPFLPIGGATRRAERSPLVTDFQCRRGVHRRQDNYRVKKFVSGSCRPLMAQAKCIGNAGGRGATSSTVPEPQESMSTWAGDWPLWTNLSSSGTGSGAIRSCPHSSELLPVRRILLAGHWQLLRAPVNLVPEP